MGMERLNITTQHEEWLGSTWKEDCELTKNLLLAINPNLLIVDHYAIDHRWENCVRTIFTNTLCVIDDLADRKHHAHVLIDYTLGRHESDYLKLVSQNCKLLLGLSYAILRQEFLLKVNKNDKLTKKTLNILINMGGMDKNNVTLEVIKLAQSFNTLEKIQLVVIVGDKYKKYEDLKLYLSKQKYEYQLEKNTKNMVGYMNLADFAISSIGTTTWELFSQGVPSIFIPIATQQVPHAKQIQNNSLGYVILDDFQNILKNYAEKLISDPTTRQNLSQRTSKLVDGLGAQRVVLELIKAIKL